ncbi:hypothetical protein SLS63_013160 [Diaporthe eres]|uniref:Peptidase S8/S53 domain-containing protein n=1 Tax=Diaporthe eres TaxID=83184 RepID=A0ABR1NPA4_DIAER
MEVDRPQKVEKESKNPVRDPSQKFEEFAKMEVSHQKWEFPNIANDFLLNHTQTDPGAYFGQYERYMKKTEFDDILTQILARLAPPAREKSSLPKFLHWLIGVNKRVLTKVDKDTSKTPLLYSLYKNMHVVVETILKIVVDPKQNLGVVLEESEERSYGTCLHMAIQCESPSLKVMADKCNSFPDQFGKLDWHGNTPLHLLAQCRGSELDIEHLEDILQGRLGQIEKPELATTETANDRDHAGHIDKSESSQIKRAEFRQIEFRVQVLETMAKALNSALKQKNKEGMTPYQLRLHTIESSQNVKDVLKRVRANQEIGESNSTIEMLRERAKRTIIAKDPVAKAIRTFCIRTFTKPDDIVECLYRPGEERHLEFDLAGFPGRSIREDFLLGLQSHIRFESFLRYVALPKLIVEPSKRSVYAARIMKVAVVDYRPGDSSHRDSVITKALADFQVEYWNWKKLDLCSDVISNSTEIVQEVSMYWSGNPAVMMGWASREGFSNKTKFPEGYEEWPSTEEQLRKFKDRIECSETSAECQAQTQLSSISVFWVRDNEMLSYASDFKTSEDGPEERTNPWLEIMENFSRALRTIKPRPEVQFKPVKIAIIDDGIDATQPELHQRIVMGRSFSPYLNSTEFMNAYFVPSGNHGTLMATLICKICPKPQLYVARLEERLSKGGGRLITAKSAVEAIKWAAACGVDIISMSWTIESRESNKEDTEMLKGAVQAAERQGILLFGSASDQGGGREERTYPAKGCIKIGGASAHGDKLTWVNEDTVDFLLPGRRIPFKNMESDTFSYETGSSLATACASGLAGALLYAARVLGSEKLCKRDNLVGAFKGMRMHKSNFIDVKEHLKDDLEKKLKNDLMWDPSDWNGKETRDTLKRHLESIIA